MIRKNRLKANLAAGRKSLGMWLQSADPTFAEIVALVGFDFFVMDQEHGPGDVQAAIDMIRAAAVTDATSVIRVPSSDPIYLRRIADAGAEGVLVPMVESDDEARMIVDACHYTPRSTRGDAPDINTSSCFVVTTAT